MDTEFGQYIQALRRHWAPLATGGIALVVSFMVGLIYGEHAPLWIWVTIVAGSIVIASFLAWREIQREKDNLKNEIDVLNTPAVLLRLHKIDENFIDGDHQTLFIEIEGIGVEETRPQVFAIEVQQIGKGKECAIGEPGPHLPFGVRRGETHNVAVVTYCVSKWFSNMHIDIPCKKIMSKAYFVGDYFRMKVCAFGSAKEAELEFEFGLDDGTTLWARNIGSSEKVLSEFRALARQQKELDKK